MQVVDAEEALGQLDLALDPEARKTAIAQAEPLVLHAVSEMQWDLVIDLAGALAEAWAESDGWDRSREWAQVALDAATTLEGEDGGPATLAAATRLGQIELETGAIEASHQTFLRAVDVAERAFGPEAPALVDPLLFACAGATPDFAVDLATRALDIAEGAEGDLLPALLEVTSAMIEAERPDDALPYAMRAVELAEQTGDDDDTAAHGLLSRALLASGRPLEAREVLDRVPHHDDPWLAELRGQVVAALSISTQKRPRSLHTDR